jgi:hypothetical protein
MAYQVVWNERGFCLVGKRFGNVQVGHQIHFCFKADMALAAKFGSCPGRWCRSRLMAVLSDIGPEGYQRATAGRLIWGSSLICADGLKGHVAARWTAHSSFCSSSKAPTSRTMASSLGKMPTTSVRRLISPLRRSSGFVVQLGPMLLSGRSCRRAHRFFGVVHEGGELWNFRSDLIGDAAPLLRLRPPASPGRRPWR